MRPVNLYRDRLATEHDLSRLRLDHAAAARGPGAAGGRLLWPAVALGPCLVRRPARSAGGNRQRFNGLSPTRPRPCSTPPAMSSPSARPPWHPRPPAAGVAGVMEGSRVKAGEVIARPRKPGYRGQVEQVAANITAMRGQRVQAEAELTDARRATSGPRIWRPSASSPRRRWTAPRPASTRRGPEGGGPGAVAQAEAARRVAQVALDQTEIRRPSTASC